MNQPSLKYLVPFYALGIILLLGTFTAQGQSILTYKRDIKKLNTANDSLRKLTIDLKDLIDEKTAQILKLQTQITSYEIKLAQSDAKRTEDLHTENVKFKILTDSITDAKKQISQIQITINRLSENLNKVNQDIDKNRGKSDSLTILIENEKLQNLVNGQRIDSLGKKLEESQIKNDSAISAINTSQAEKATSGLNEEIKTLKENNRFYKMLLLILCPLFLGLFSFTLWKMFIPIARIWDVVQIKCLVIEITDYVVIAKALIRENKENPVTELRKFDRSALKGILEPDNESQVFVLTIKTSKGKKEFIFSKGNPYDKELFNQKVVEPEFAKNLQNKINNDPFFQKPPFRAN